MDINQHMVNILNTRLSLTDYIYVYGNPLLNKQKHKNYKTISVRFAISQKSDKFLELEAIFSKLKLHIQRLIMFLRWRNALDKGQQVDNHNRMKKSGCQWLFSNVWKEIFKTNGLEIPEPSYRESNPSNEGSNNC